MDNDGMRKHYTAAFKAQVVHEVLKEEKTIAQIAAIQGVHPKGAGKSGGAASICFKSPQCRRIACPAASA